MYKQSNYRKSPSIAPKHRNVLRASSLSHGFDRVGKPCHHKTNGNDNALGQLFLEEPEPHKRGKHGVEHHHRLHLAQVVTGHGHIVTESRNCRARNPKPPVSIAHNTLEKLPRVRNTSRPFAHFGNPRFLEDVAASKTKRGADSQ